MILTTIICLLLFGLFVYYYWTKMGSSSVIYATALLVAPMSHIWHIAYGEGRITCDSVEDRAFGWTPCWTGSWDQWTDTYEVTLPIEFLFLAALVFYVDDKPSVRIMNGMHIILTIILLFASPKLLDVYANIFNITGLIASIGILILSIK